MFSTWPPDLLETLCRSFKAHSTSNRYLDNAFWAGEPASFEEALNRLGGAVQTNALKWVHTRAAAIPGLWPFISFIHNLWSGDSHGFAFSCSDKGRLRAFLDASNSFCRDIPLMMSDHQAAGPTNAGGKSLTERQACTFVFLSTTRPTSAKSPVRVRSTLTLTRL